jgi:hypothetical protein
MEREKMVTEREIEVMKIILYGYKVEDNKTEVFFC